MVMDPLKSQTGGREAAVCSAGPICLGALGIATRYWLSPLAGYTNLAFRLAVRELGGLGMATTDLVNARALLQGGRKSMELVQTCPADRPLAVQIYGAEPEEMIAAAQWLESSGVSAVDINMGCPVHKVVRGGGSAIMCDAHRAVGLVRVVVEAVSIPVTVKMRLGWDEANLTAPLLARKFEQVGVAAVIIHGRTRAQGFAGAVNLAAIRTVVEAVERIPVVGNGDVLTIEDAIRMRALTVVRPSLLAGEPCSIRGFSRSLSAGKQPAIPGRRRPIRTGCASCPTIFVC